MDIDLTILGQSKNDFNKYENQIRKEYDFVSDREFAQGRKKILNSFLSSPRIYKTDYFFKKYEKKARENLNYSIKRLEGII